MALDAVWMLEDRPNYGQLPVLLLPLTYPYCIPGTPYYLPAYRAYVTPKNGKIRNPECYTFSLALGLLQPFVLEVQLENFGILKLRR
jgi:hypothetical protein